MHATTAGAEAWHKHVYGRFVSCMPQRMQCIPDCLHAMVPCHDPQAVLGHNVVTDDDDDSNSNSTLVTLKAHQCPAVFAVHPPGLP